ncbi:MAG: endolytic transglycosylase MltG [Bacteroidales bacterium]
MRNNRSHKKRIATVIILIIFILGGIKVFQTLQNIYGPNVTIEEDYDYLHIPTDSDLNDVTEILAEEKIIEDTSSFLWLAEKKNYHNHVQPGQYRITNQMSNNELINLLRSGEQTPVSLTINNIQTKEELAGKISQQIEADSAKLIKLLNDNEFLEQYGFSDRTVQTMILPNTYEFWWNTSAEDFMNRMHKEYERFWNSDRQEKAKELNLSPIKVSTLASIVDEETIRNDEMQKIAGVYINRLKKGMRLQADPTVKFASDDITINRVLKKHLEINSPYNTYKNYGLPPGPISFPSIAAIESVLDYEDHNYLYFSAKADFSGYHNFSETHRQHLINARKYQRALNKKDIMQ